MVTLSTRGSNNQSKNCCLHKGFTEAVRLKVEDLFLFPLILGLNRHTWWPAVNVVPDGPRLAELTLRRSAFPHCAGAGRCDQMGWGRRAGLVCEMGPEKPQLPSRALRLSGNRPRSSSCSGEAVRLVLRTLWWLPCGQTPCEENPRLPANSPVRSSPESVLSGPFKAFGDIWPTAQLKRRPKPLSQAAPGSGP